jgi:hypothetical protein
MSNAVDILVVGGPHDGIVLCQPRPVPATIVHEGVTYTSTIHDDVYRVFRYDVEDGADVDAAIVAAPITYGPAWDLRGW